MITEDARCADASIAANEPLAGSAALAWRWLFIEVREPWSRKGFPDCGLPRRVLARLNKLGKNHDGVRVTFIRRPTRCEGPLAFFFADTSADAPRVHAFELADHSDLLTLPLDDLIAAPVAPTYDAPLFMVCTHGVRDACCARLGAPVYRAMEARAPGRVWQATHLGGHRFAATLLALPHGLCYGRVSPPEAAAIASAHARGRLYTDLDRLRGRCCWPPHVQAAEHALRRDTDDRGLDTITLAADDEDGPDSWRVTLRTPTGEHAYALSRAPLDAQAPPSCGKPLKTPMGYTARAL